MNFWRTLDERVKPFLGFSKTKNKRTFITYATYSVDRSVWDAYAPNLELVHEINSRFGNRDNRFWYEKIDMDYPSHVLYLYTRLI